MLNVKKIESLLNFVKKRQKRIDDKKRRAEEEAKRKREKTNEFIKKYWMFLLGAFIALILIVSFGIWSERNDQNDATKIAINSSSSEFKGKNYKNVVTQLHKAGFTNIKTEALDDLVTGLLKKDGEVEGVKIDNITNFGSDTKFSKEAKIIITYHTFPKENESDATISVDDNTEDINKGDLENSVEDNSESTNTEKESIYEKGYRVRFQDYDICYLIDEDEHTISIFDTIEEYTDVYTSVYTGDFNNGINFDWNGLKMRAHYNYVDNDATLIIYDESGNENKALNLGVDIIEGYIKLRPNDN